MILHFSPFNHVLSLLFLLRVLAHHAPAVSFLFFFLFFSNIRLRTRMAAPTVALTQGGVFQALVAVRQQKQQQQQVPNFGSTLLFFFFFYG